MLYAVCCMLLACQDKPVCGPNPVLPSQVIDGFTLHESSSGKRLYTLEAQEAYVYDPVQRVDVTGLRVLFYDDAGGIHSTLVADEGSIYSKNEDLVARGHVIVRTSDSTMLTTDSLSWSNQGRLVRTDADLVIETPKGRIEGKGLVSDAGLNKIDILSPVKGTSDYDFETGK
ncbi:MAG: LPS export ABC transporter periplasmic protein LptC [candidate division WOR-3 bacterium]|nr:LPS export ABC transporter periplasmic protein LptC [candidate division WOR-3 bacterium]